MDVGQMKFWYYLMIFAITVVVTHFWLQYGYPDDTGSLFGLWLLLAALFILVLFANTLYLLYRSTNLQRV
jgi:hypothetical protein